tara:strand:- start:747 stop:1247 length:501 start_codon:yes stop_codon:yes gene_type:complete
MHPAAYGWVLTCLKAHGQPKSVIEIGSRDINGSVRDLFKGAQEYTGLDLLDGPGVDWVGDALRYLPDFEVECVVSTEVFEHCEYWPEMILAAGGWLKPGGFLIATMATTGRAPHSARDEKPIRPEEWYKNITDHDLDSAFTRTESFVLWDIDTQGTDIRVFAETRE